MKYSAIDLHSNNSVVVVTDERDRVLERRRVVNDPATILAVLAAHRDELVGVVVESTYNWYWLVASGLTNGDEPSRRIRRLPSTADIREISQ